MGCSAHPFGETLRQEEKLSCTPGAGLSRWGFRCPCTDGRFYVLFLFRLLSQFFVMENFKHTQNF